MRVGILKPDHLGDLVLAAPAVAALRRRFDDLTLFCQPAAMPLAAYLFPGLPLRPVVFPHLDRTCRTQRVSPELGALRDQIDLLVCLRWDRVLARVVEDSGLDYRASHLDRLDVHAAAEQRAVVAPLAGEYDLLTSYRHSALPRPERPAALGAVGLCIAAGFVRNAWPLNYWLELAEGLRRHGSRIVLVGGPVEAARLGVLAEALDDLIGYRPRVLAGGNDFGTFLGELAAAVDLVIATDSGTAHLASLVRPVVSLFGGSPWRQYAPLGRFNAVLTREEPCSPCVQFDRTRLQTCHTHECLTRLAPEQVFRSLTAYLAQPESPRRQRVGDVWMMRAPWESGVSAAARRQITAGLGQT
jgi:ADP-heptose:LPS heptosyltransferase